MAGRKKDKTLEEAFTELETIIETLEQEPASLEDSFQLYKKGMDMIKDCNKDIDKVEKQLIVLQNTDSDVEE